jgi:hypothetical protein
MIIFIKTFLTRVRVIGTIVRGRRRHHVRMTNYYKRQLQSDC